LSAGRLTTPLPGAVCLALCAVAVRGWQRQCPSTRVLGRTTIPRRGAERVRKLPPDQAGTEYAERNAKDGKRVLRVPSEDLNEPRAPMLPEDVAPAVIIGGGRVGDALEQMGVGEDIVLGREDPFPEDAPDGPIFVCTRNDSLKAVIAKVPKERHEDLVFIQNGALMPFLEREVGSSVPYSILLVYFAVAKKGERPIDGKTETDPKGLTAVNATGKWAKAIQFRLYTNNPQLSCTILSKPMFYQAYWEKNLWIAAYMLVGALHGGCTIGDVEAQHRAEVDDLIGELATALSASFPEIRWERGLLFERLAAYARSVAHFPTAVKEFEWRNGAFYELTKRALAAGRDDPCPSHTEGLRMLGMLPVEA